MAGAGGREVGRISIRVVPNTDGFRRQLKKQLEKLDDDIRAKVDLDPSSTAAFKKKVDKATKGLKAKVELEPERSSVQRFARLMDKIKFPSFGSGINPTGWAVIAVGALTAIGPALGLITTALLAIPGLMAGILTPIAAISLGMEGIGKAAARLAAPLEALKTTMSSVNESAFTPVFDKMATVFPKLGQMLPVVSRGVASLAQSLVDAVARPENLTKIQDTIANIGDALTRAAPGVGSFTSGLITLADELSKKFPSVGDWFSEAGANFDKFISKLAESGDLSEAFGGLGDSLKTILDLVTQLGQRGLEFMGDPANVEKMATAFSNIANALERVAKASNRFFEILDRIENSSQNRTLEDQGVGAALKEAVDPDNIWGKDTGDKWKRVAGQRFADAFNPENLFGKNDFSKGLWEKIKEGFDPNNLFGKDTGQELLNSIGMASAAAETGQQTGQNLASGIKEGMQGIGGAAGATPFIDPAVIQAQIAGVVAQFQAIGPQVQAALAAATAPLQQVPALIQQAFSGIGAAVTGSMAVVVSAVAGAGQQIVAAFTAALSQLPGIATQAFASLAAIATGSMAQVTAAIANGMQQSVAAVQAGAQQIIAALQSAASGAQAAGAAIGNGMAAGIRSSQGAAVAAARDLAAAVTAAAQVQLGIKSPSKVFQEIGWNTAKGFEDGFESGFNKVIDKSKELTGKLGDSVMAGAESMHKDLEGSKPGTGFDFTKALEIPKNFAEATAGQFMDDLGISGKGALPELARYGIDFGSQFVFNVANIDDAMAVKQNQVNKQALQYTGTRR